MVTRPEGPYDYHPSTSETIEDAARAIGRPVEALAGLDPALRKRLPPLERNVSDLLTEPVQTPVWMLVPVVRETCRAAAVASEAVGYFASAVREFDSGVAGLNTEYASLVAERDNVAEHRSGGADLAPAPSVGQLYGDRLAELNRRYHRVLVPRLDAGAELTRSFLERGTAQDNVRLLYVLTEGEPGSLYSPLPRLFPGLDLTGQSRSAEVVAALQDPEIAHDLVQAVPAETLSRTLNGPRLPTQVRNLIVENRADAVEVFSQEWTLDAAGRVPDDLCRPHSNGGIVGPDGRIYWVDVPQRPPGPVATNPGTLILDDGPGSGWKTLDRRLGEVEQGAPVTGLERAVWALSGQKYPGETWSIGSDQGDYVTTTPDGRVVLNPDLYVPEDNHSGTPPSLPPADYHRSVNVSNYAELLTNLGDGLVTGDKVEANRHGTSHVTFQENDDGTLRAVISLNQVRTDGENVFVDSSLGTLDNDGSVVPVQ